MSISQISPLPQPPQRSDAPDIFAGRADAFVAALAPFVNETNQLGGELNQKADDAESAASEAEQAKQEAETARDAALGAPSLVNYQGVWEAGTYNTGESVYHTPSDAFYISDEDGNTDEPASGAWRKVGTAESTPYDNSESGLNADNVQDAVDEVLATSVPSGAVMNFAMPTAPSGWLEADGSEVSRTQYSALFNAIGTVWGEGDGSTTFNLPDARGEFLRGWDNDRGVDSGRAFGSSQSSQNEAHSHSGSTNSAGSHTHSGGTSGVGDHIHGGVPSYTLGSGDTEGGVGRVTGNGTTAGGGGHSHSFTTNSAGSHGHNFSTNSSGGNESRPRNIAMLTCIKI